MKREQTVRDWWAMIDQLMRKGLNLKEIGDAMGCQITHRMICHYRAGVQPLHWRGECLLDLWCRTTNQDRSAAPTTQLVRGRRRVDFNRPLPTGPQMQSLPDWPKAAPPTVNPLKARKRKEVA